MKKTAFEIADYAWNPISGCLKDCRKCVARRQAARFTGDTRETMLRAEYWDNEKKLFLLNDVFWVNEKHQLNYPYGFRPTYHRYRLDWLEKLKRGSNVTVCAMGELFGDWIPDQVIMEVLDACKQTPRHNYIFMTKNPKRYMELASEGLLPKESNFWYGSSISGQDEEFFFSECHKTFLNIEPFTGRFDSQEADHDCLSCMDWVVMGALTGSNKVLQLPEKSSVEAVLRKAKEKCIPVYMKNNLQGIGTSDFLQEYPEEFIRDELDVRSSREVEMYDAVCPVCERQNRKNAMYAVLLQRTKGTSAKASFHVCKRCEEEFMKLLPYPAPEGVTSAKHGFCSICHRGHKKSEMLTISTRDKRKIKTRGYVCEICENDFMKNLKTGEKQNETNSR